MSQKIHQSGVLQTHMLTHSDKFAHLCDICGRSFRQRSQLVTHRRRHQGIRPFACSECESKFTTKGDFDRHLRTHTGERPHHCDVCGSSFARAQTLQEHKNRHFNFKPYICKICGKSFYELTACSRHIKSTHGRDGSNASPSDNIIRSSSARAYQDEIKERIHLVQNTASDGVFTERNVVIQENEEITLSKEDQTKFITVHDEKIEIIEASEQTTINDRYPSQNTKLVCKDCGSSFSSYKGLNAHGRYCKHKKKNNYEGVPVTQWLAEHTASYSSINQGDDLDESESSKSKGECAAEETCEPVEYIQEIEDSSVSHAVSIDEDGSITSLPLSQLAPIHIQLEKRMENDEIRRSGLVKVSEVIRELRLRWYGRVLRIDDEEGVKRAWKEPVRGRKLRGRQRIRWRDKVKDRMERRGLVEDDALKAVEKAHQATDLMQG
ncbi:zinc finger protein 501-like [Macrobrachium nipponense]|uniref:zinc finger protein 501-like n=1 Tax=Macrobrachium nipponense TaxID=159736 RepID=UPI0030C828CF